MPPERDRDEQGRPRNARPRDRLGRPIDRDSAGVDRVPDDLVLPPQEALVQAQRFLDAGQPFHAHEVLEGVWKHADPSEAELWRALAQITVGHTHQLRGNRKGARALFERGGSGLASYAGPTPDALDVPSVLYWIQGALDDAPPAPLKLTR